MKVCLVAFIATSFFSVLSNDVRAYDELAFDIDATLSGVENESGFANVSEYAIGSGWIFNEALSSNPNFVYGTDVLIQFVYNEEIVTLPSKPVIPPTTKPSTIPTGDSTTTLHFALLLAATSGLLYRKHKKKF